MDLDFSEMFVAKRACATCQYTWFPRAKDPKRCPRCQRWLPHEDEKDALGRAQDEMKNHK
jgi:ssDNA-binding Zn-finger/Zn-ribbon topoisomerase 1